jgi:FkbM family methyltransferase
MVKNIKNWDNYLIYKLNGQKSPIFTFEMRNSFSVSVPRQIIPEFKENIFEEIYYKHLPSQIKDVDKPIVLDIGANVGFFTIFSLFKLRNPKIISFEPIKRNFEGLQNNLQSIKKDDVIAVNQAVNGTKGELILKFNQTQAFTTSASLFDNLYGSDEEIVMATTLEDIFLEYSLPKIDILKLDCEGAEYNIFYNTPSHFFEKINCIALETHLGKGAKENTSALASHIEALGFAVITHQKDFIWAAKNPQHWV